MYKILVADDEQKIREVIKEYAEYEGHSVSEAVDGMQAVEMAKEQDFDIIIMDVMMPRLDGLSVVKHMRASGDATPVLFLTARDSVEDKVRGLDLGANDYLVKPFSFEELMARVRALTRKSTAENSPVYEICDLKLDTGSHSVTRSDKKIKLSAKEFALLEYLLRNKGQVLSREKIENNLWNFDYEGGTNAVDVYIRYLRKKIDEDFSPRLIHTVRGVGYVLKDESD